MKQVLDSGWVSLASSAVIGALCALVSATFWISDNDNKLEAHAASIERLEHSVGGLEDIHDRLARIEGKLDVILNNRLRGLPGN